MERSLRSVNHLGTERVHPIGDPHATNDDDRSSKNPLVCFQYLTNQLYALGFEREVAKDVDTCSSSQMTVDTSSTTTDVNNNNGSQVVVGSRSSTFTPKRRRKENGRGSRVRFSPEKKHHWQDTISRSGSLLDEQTQSNEEDEQSQLVGARIPQPHSYPNQYYDELTYSDSEASPEVVRDLRDELIWEKLGDGIDDNQQNDIESHYDGESYDSLPSRKLSSALYYRNDGLQVVRTACGSQQGQGQRHSAPPCKMTKLHASMVGGVVTVMENTIRPRSLKATGRQVSECSDLTCDSSQCSAYSSKSRDSVDSGAMSPEEEPFSHQHGGTRSRNDEATEMEENSLHRMRSADETRPKQSSHHHQRRKRSSGRSRKRRSRKHRGRKSTNTMEHDQQSSPETKGMPAVVEEEAETSILVDLTEDLREIAILAGRSSESLMANIFQHLYEGP